MRTLQYPSKFLGDAQALVTRISCRHKPKGTTTGCFSGSLLLASCCSLSTGECKGVCETPNHGVMRRLHSRCTNQIWSPNEYLLPQQATSRTLGCKFLARIARNESCSARELLWRTTIWKRLQSLRVSHTGFCRSCPVSCRTKVSSQPNVLFPPTVGSCSRTAVSNSSSRSNSWRSTMTWYSSPERAALRDFPGCSATEPEPAPLPV